MRIPESIFIVISCFLAPTVSDAQLSAKDSSMRTAAVYNALQQYHLAVGDEAPLYNGQQYEDYEANIHVGHPYFQSREFFPASIVYDNILYENIPLRFDLVKKKLVIKSRIGEFHIMILDDKVSRFEVQGHQFLRLTKDSSNRKTITTGFYDLLYHGNSVQLLKKESKKILEEVNSFDGVKRSIVDETAYFFQKGGIYYPINSKSQALALMKDKADLMKQYIRKNQLKFRADKDNDLVKLVGYYDASGN